MSRRKFREDKSKFYGTKQVLQDLNQGAHTVVHDLDPSAAGRANFRGEWSSGTAYYPGDIVSYHGNLYLAVALVGPSVLSPDVDPAHWSFFAHSADAMSGTVEFHVPRPARSGKVFIGGTIATTRSAYGRFYTQNIAIGSLMGLYYDTAGGPNGTDITWLAAHDSAGGHISEYLARNGKMVRQFGGSGTWRKRGVVRAGTYVITLEYDSATGKYWLRRYLQSDGSFVSEADIDSLLGAVDVNVALFTSDGGTTVTTVGATGADSAYYLTTFTQALAQTGSVVRLDFPEVGAGWDTFGAAYKGGYLFISGYHNLTGKVVTAWDIVTQRRQPQVEWVSASEGGIGWDGVRFFNTGGFFYATTGQPASLSGLTVGAKVNCQQSMTPAAGLGDRIDSYEMDSFTAMGQVISATQIEVHWRSDRALFGNYTLDYDIPG